MTDTLLDINTAFERPEIRIDGELHELVSPEEMSIVTSTKLDGLGRKLDRLRQAESVSEADEKRLAKTLDAIAAIIMEPVPKPVRAKLTDAQKLSVIEVFSMLLLERKARLAGGTALRALAARFLDTAKAAGVDLTKDAAPQEKPPTMQKPDGGKSPPDASGFTAATPGDG